MDAASVQRYRKACGSRTRVIDDGGHRPVQQAVSLEELLLHLRPGGVYICEDVHGVHNRFNSYVAGLVQALNEASAMEADLEKP